MLGVALCLLPLAGGARPVPPGVDAEEYLKATQTIRCDCGCHPQSVYDCACGRAAEMRDGIAAEIHAGSSGDEVIASYVARFGEQIRIAPPSSGFNLVAWLGPSLLFLAAAAALALLLRHWRRQPAVAAATAQGETLDPEYVERLQRELKDYAE